MWKNWKNKFEISRKFDYKLGRVHLDFTLVTGTDRELAPFLEILKRAQHDVEEEIVNIIKIEKWNAILADTYSGKTKRAKKSI